MKMLTHIMRYSQQPDVLDFTLTNVQDWYVLEHGWRPPLKKIKECLDILQATKFVALIEKGIAFSDEISNSRYCEVKKEKYETLVKMWKNSHKEKEFSTLTNTLYGCGFSEDLISKQSGKSKTEKNQNTTHIESQEKK
jgi:hypothetical protein